MEFQKYDVKEKKERKNEQTKTNKVVKIIKKIYWSGLPFLSPMHESEK